MALGKIVVVILISETSSGLRIFADDGTTSTENPAESRRQKNLADNDTTSAEDAWDREVQRNHWDQWDQRLQQNPGVLLSPSLPIYSEETNSETNDTCS